jgi:hypothetical protein
MVIGNRLRNNGEPAPLLVAHHLDVGKDNLDQGDPHDEAAADPCP